MSGSEWNRVAPQSTGGVVSCCDKDGCNTGANVVGGAVSAGNVPGAPLVFTSYTRTEAEADLQRFTEHCDQEVEILVNCQENKMRSHRPIRDWEMDREMDVFYSNQFITVVRCQN